MAKILLKRVPKKTDKASQQRVMKEWSATIVEKYSAGRSIPICSANEIRSKSGSYMNTQCSKKGQP